MEDKNVAVKSEPAAPSDVRPAVGTMIEGVNTPFAYTKFLLCSFAGLALFLIPIKWNGDWTIGVSILSDSLMVYIEPVIAWLCVTITPVSAILSLLAKLAKPRFIMEHKMMKDLFDVEWFWVIIRALGGIFIVMVFLQVGPEFIVGELTGTVAYNMVVWLGGLITLCTWLIVFLTDFGFMEFCGVMAEKIMRPVFKLPGRSALDCIASWLAAPPVAVMITVGQYEDGYYTDREASVVSTCFSLVGISAVLVHIQNLHLKHYFFPIYGTVCIAGVACAIICARIYPLGTKKDTYYKGVCNAVPQQLPANTSRFSFAMNRGLAKAQSVKSAGPLARLCLKNTADIWIGLAPVIMALATIALILAEYTPVFDILSYPFVPLLNLLQIPEAAAVAPTFLIGFPDQLMAAVVGGATVTSEYSRIVIAIVSLNQLIYMSETGALLMKSSLSINFKQLVIIFLERTIITLPFAMIAAHLLTA
ncbi:YjiH family protein [Anaerotruncus rubiinfantis]|uniref:YjiH family protein n=1 Tax=Anaerotruncus rubiinfantis TaxID=1720200 RepID=UPI0034A3AB33